MKTHPLTKWFEATGKSRAEFAREAGVSRMAIWRIMNGDRRLSLSLLEKVSGASGIPVSKLISESKRQAAE